MPRYLSFFLIIIFFFKDILFMLCFVLTSPPLMLCVYLQTFEVALYWKKKKYVGTSFLLPRHNGTTTI